MDIPILLQFLSKFLGVCVLLAFALLLFWFGFYALAGDFAFDMQSRWFPIERREWEVMNYAGMGFFKLAALMFFVTPYLAVKIAQRCPHCRPPEKG